MPHDAFAFILLIGIIKFIIIARYQNSIHCWNQLAVSTLMQPNKLTNRFSQNIGKRKLDLSIHYQLTVNFFFIFGMNLFSKT
jgi:hypothetical protein